jgi:7-cyano-7-deazaguanine tRNA-ribosyltransferase
MSFEVKDKDLLGRIGKLRTKNGLLETPAFMPVVNPLLQTISPRRMKREFGCEVIITNSYIIKSHFGELPGLELHRFLDYDGVIFTDSGAYQILIYGEVGVTQPEIIGFQKSINTDVGVILDIPTGWDEPRSRVEYTVRETLRRAKEALPLISDSDILWVGPVQGGRHLDLVAYSAQKIAEMPYDIHALGSPTEVMERYNYPVLVDMVMTAKKNLPLERPLHLFGAGHPMMFALAVAMGCDLFDSAAYTLYAKDMRYITSRGTVQLQNLQYLPCSCPVCRSITSQDLKELPKGERQSLVAEHNLHVTMAEMEIVKQAITEGTLWDLVEARAKSHPQMTSAFKKLADYKEELEQANPGFKGHGVFYYDYNSLAKPQVTRYKKQVLSNYAGSQGREVLLLFRAPEYKPFNHYPGFLNVKRKLKQTLNMVEICFFVAPYGVVPELLSETYPLSQFELAEPIDHETTKFTVKNVLDYIKAAKYSKVILIIGYGDLDAMLEDALNSMEVDLRVIKTDSIWSDETVSRISEAYTG